MKKGSFIAKNYELIQEFYFAHPISKLKMSLIYNCHFTGSPLWDLFSQEAIKLENSWNVFIRKIYDLPMTTHRYFIEPVSQQLHLKKLLIKSLFYQFWCLKSKIRPRYDAKKFSKLLIDKNFFYFDQN